MKLRTRLVALSLFAPMASGAVGVDGAPLFQILAAENLGLDPRAIGVALGLGTLSVPLQIWSARLSLNNIGRRLRWFVLITAAFTFATAALVLLAPPGSWVAGLVLVIAVLAEIAVSLLWATSWQPLLGSVLGSEDRQFVNGRARSGIGIIRLVAVFGFAQLDRPGRAVFLILMGLAVLLAGCAIPGEPEGGSAPSAASGRLSWGELLGTVRRFSGPYLALAFLGFAGWPLVVTYVARVGWPDANLGVVAVAASIGSIGAAWMWKPTTASLNPRLWLGVGLCSAATATMLLVRVPVVSGLGRTVLLAALTVNAFGVGRLHLALLEIWHRSVDESDSVAVLTMADVVGSTCNQIGFTIGGFLIAASADGPLVGPVDSYRAWLVVAVAGLTACIWWLTSVSPFGRKTC